MKNRFIVHSTDATSLSFPVVHAAILLTLSDASLIRPREAIKFSAWKSFKRCVRARGGNGHGMNTDIKCSPLLLKCRQIIESWWWAHTHTVCWGWRVNVPVSYSVHFNERIQVLNALYALFGHKRAAINWRDSCVLSSKSRMKIPQSSCVNLREFSFNFLSAHRWNPEQISSSCWQMLARLEVVLSSNSPLNHLDRIYQIFMLWFDDDDDDDTER